MYKEAQAAIDEMEHQLNAPTAWRCKHCRQPVSRNEEYEPYAHEVNGIVLMHDRAGCSTPEKDPECPLYYDYNDGVYYILPRILENKQ
jgi:hypothetical protein